MSLDGRIPVIMRWALMTGAKGGQPKVGSVDRSWREGGRDIELMCAAARNKVNGWRDTGRNTQNTVLQLSRDPTYLVHLVSYDDLDDSRGDVRLKLGEPPRKCIERLPVGYIVHQDNPLCSSVIRRGDGPETLLPCRILTPGHSG